MNAAYRWKPHELEALLAVLRSADLTRRLPIRKGLEAVGWASLPDPDGILYRRVKKKLNVMHTRMRNGVEPVPEQTGKSYQNKATTWTAWIRAALAHVGDQEFTNLDVMAMLEANPDISPILDRRPDPDFKTRLRWQSNFCYTFKTVPGLVWTGRKRGRCKLYRYDPTDPTAVPAKRRRQPKKGVPGLPHLGRHEKSRGDAAAVVGRQRQ